MIKFCLFLATLGVGLGANAVMPTSVWTEINKRTDFKGSACELRQRMADVWMSHKTETEAIGQQLVAYGQIADRNERGSAFMDLHRTVLLERMRIYQDLNHLFGTGSSVLVVLDPELTEESVASAPRGFFFQLRLAWEEPWGIWPFNSNNVKTEDFRGYVGFDGRGGVGVCFGGECDGSAEEIVSLCETRERVSAR